MKQIPKNKTHKPAQKKTGSGIFRNCMVVLIMAIALLGAGAFGAQQWYQSAVNQPPSELNQDSFTVAEGESLIDIAPDLEAAGILSDTNALRIYIRLENPSINLLPGKYPIEQSLTIPQLIDVINQGPEVATTTITIQEGLRYDEIAEIISKGFDDLPDNSFDKQEYLAAIQAPMQAGFNDSTTEFIERYIPEGNSLEGFLFPDTYTLATDATATQIIELQINTLQRRLDENNLKPEGSDRIGDFYDVVTLASILEREAGTGENLLIVSDIFIKRLEDGWTLDADATYLYEKKDWQFPLNQQLLRSDRSNIYNTYVFTGLTPTPISNPGVEAINAAFNPKPNPYYFFITGNDGNNYYARNNTEHVNNVRLYL